MKSCNKRTYCGRRDIQIPCPDDRFLLVQVPNIRREVLIPQVLLVQRLQTCTGIGHIGAHDVGVLELEGDDAALRVVGIWVSREGPGDGEGLVLGEDGGAG